MPDPTDGSQAAQDAEAAAKTTTTTTTESTDEAFDKDRALATIRGQREREKALAKELSDLKAEKAERERKEQEAAEVDAKKRGEFEQLAQQHQTKAAKLESDLTAERDARKADRVRYEVLTTAQRLGMVDSDAAYVLLDRAQVQFGEDGAPTNVEALLKDLLKAKPYLQGQANGAAAPKGAPTSPRPAGGSNGQEDVAARAAHAQMYRGL